MQSAWAAGWAAAVVTYVVISHLLPPELAWRAMFAAGVAPAGIVLWLRGRVASLPSRPLVPVPPPGRALMARRLALTGLIGLGAHGGYHSLFTWLPTLIRRTHGYSSTLTGLILLAMTAAFAVGCVAGGQLADRIGRRPTIALFAGSAAVSAACFSVAGGDIHILLPLALWVGVSAGGTPAVLGAWFSELFPASVRGAGVGFAYNAGRLAAAILPGVIGWASAFSPLGPLIGSVAAASYAGVIVLLPFLPETRGVALDGAGT